MESGRSWFVSIILAGGLLIAVATAAFAQNPLEVAPDMYKLKFENERVRVMEVTFAPGASIAMHSHPDHFVHVASGGKLTLSYPDGTSKELEAKAGEILWIDAESHAAINPGDTEVKLLVVELKEPKQ